ncbi:hypothetical protein EBU71_07230 [bacterium]|nr:hypothetical protein [Candidatus Elulimicrobium humile]
MKTYKVILSESSFVFNVGFLYFFLKKLTTPFEKTKAYKLGIIDDQGKNLIPRKRFTTTEQENAYTLFDVVIFNIKKMIEKLPFGKSRIATFAAALWLLKEEKNVNSYLKENVVESKFLNFLDEIESCDNVEEILNSLESELKKEDAPVNSVAGGGVQMYSPPLQMVSRKKKKFANFK